MMVFLVHKVHQLVFFVGTLVGFVLGAELGLSVGFFVGAPVGFLVGSCVGFFVGICVLCVGTYDGSPGLYGASVGRFCWKLL